MSPQSPGAKPESSQERPVKVDNSRQIRFYRASAAALLAILLIVVGALLYLRHRGQPVTLTLDGAPVARLSNAAHANEMLDTAELAKVGHAYPLDSIVRLQKVELSPLPTNSPLDTDDAAQSKLLRTLRLHVRAYAILVNGQISLGLPTDSIASDTLHAVKEHFAQLPPNAAIIDEPTFEEKVIIAPRSLDASLTRDSAEAAAPYYWTPPPTKAYKVRHGDTGLEIARRNHISFSNFITANSGVNINRLKPGDTVNVSKSPLLLTVRVQKQFSREEPIIAHAPPSAAGLRRVTYAVTYLNGQETRRSVLAMVTLTPPQARSAL